MYSYNWNDGLYNTDDLDQIGAGSYTVVITDENGCDVTTTVVLEETEEGIDVSHDTSLDTIYAGYGVSCNGATDGSIDITATGGTGVYTYNWNDGLYSTEDLDQIGAGSYTLIVEDENGCAVTTTVVLEETQPMQVVHDQSLDTIYTGYGVSCNGATDGSIDITVSGGTGVYTYNWNDGLYSTEDLDQIGAGSYTVVITDENGCDVTTTVVLEETQPMQVVHDQSLDTIYAGYGVSCNGATDGSIDITVSGGTGVYSYNWNDGLYNTDDLDQLGAGSYTVVITDENGCDVTTTVVLEETEEGIDVSHDTSLDTIYAGYGVSCNGATDGSIDITATGGTGVYTYNWNDGLYSTEDLDQIGAGSYTLIVEDENGCAVTTTVVLEETQPMQVVHDQSLDTIYTGYGVSCNGATDGSIDITVSGGTGVYTYNWNDGLYSTEDLDQIGAGSYTVVITDENGCDVTTTVVLEETQPMQVVHDQSLDTIYAGYGVSCNGATDGSIDITVSGGTGVYTYNWNDGLYSTDDLDQIGAGSYTVVITDENGCDVTTTVVLEETEEGIDVSHDTSLDTIYAGYGVSCNGATDGSVDITATGGTGVYTYNWNDGLYSTEDLDQIGAGSYTLIVEDENGCAVTTTVVLEETQPMQVVHDQSLDTIYTGYGVSCNGATDGSIDITVSGGTGVYSYNWNDGLYSTEDLDQIGAGSYTVVITDENGCDVTTTVVLEETQPMQVVHDQSLDTIYAGYGVSCNGATDGSIDITVSGGTGVYTYNWNDGLYSTDDLDQIGAGSYTVVITDENGCAVTTTVVLEETEEGIDVSHDTSLDTIYAGYGVSCNGATDGSIDITATGGTGVYTYNWNDGLYSTEDLDQIGAGSYTLIVEDENGCAVTTTVVLEETQPMQVVHDQSLDTIYTGYGVSCNGATDGSIDITVSGGTGVYTYNWNDGLYSTEDLDQIGAGSYTVVITDENGCDVTTTVVLEETQPMQVAHDQSLDTIYAGYGVSCNGATDGSIDITVSGGTGVYSYNWNDGLYSTDDLDQIGAGSYTLIVEDENGCDVTTTVVLEETEEGIDVSHDTSLDTIYAGYGVSCNGATDGSVDITATGGTGVYTYNWNDGLYSTEDLDQIGAGSYTLIVEDENGCAVTTTVVLEETQPMQVVHDQSLDTIYTGYGVSCNGATDGSIDITVSGGTGVYTYNWNDGLYSTEDLDQIGAGSYTVVITDENGCAVTTTVVLEETQPMQVAHDQSLDTIYAGYGVSCNGATDGSIDITVSGGTGVYSYNWNDGLYSTEDLDQIGAGSYTVVITDENGCDVTTTVVLEETEEGIDVSHDTSLDTIYAGYGVSCNGATDGSIDITATGGTGVYTYNWNDGLYSTEDLDQIGAGSYTLIVEDENGCAVTTTVVLEETQPMQVAHDQSLDTIYAGYGVSCNGATDGSIDITVSGGTGVYTYNWNDGLILH